MGQIQMTVDKTVDLVKEFRQTLIILDEAIGNLNALTPNAEDLADLLVELNLYKRDVGIVYDSLAQVITTAMSNAGIMSARDGAEIELKFGMNRTGWKHRDLAADVAQKIYQSCVDMDTGEVIASPMDMMQQMMNYLQPSYWKVGELSKLGLNVDNYCKAEEAKPSLIVRKGNAE